jgi:hypothetical protein
MMKSALTDLQRKNKYVADSEPTEWQRIGDEIDAAFIFARADFVSVTGRFGCICTLLSQFGRKSDSGGILCGGKGISWSYLILI